MTTLVTGATGFVGSELTRQLLAQGVSVRILRRAASRLDLLGEAAQHVEHVLGEVTDPPSLREAMRDVAQVYHAAAYIGFGGRHDRRRLHRVNVEGTACVVNAALETGVERLVHTSSIAAFGRPDQPGRSIDETAEWHPSRMNTAYAVSKHEAELEVYRGIAEGLDAVIVNPALVFGVSRPSENTRLIAERIRDGKIPAAPSGGTNVVDVEDVAAGHRRAMRYGKTGERYLLGSENLSWKTIFGTLAEAFGVEPPRRVMSLGVATTLGALAEAMAFVSRRSPSFTRKLARNTARVYTYDNRKALEELGCSFRPFADTAQRIAQAIG